MVVFNDPVPVENPALQAVLMALEMRDAIGALTETWHRLQDIGFGIGIAHGFATLGTIGFEGRFDYAAIGTVSNVASRLCDEAKPGQILISPRVLMKVENAVTVEPVGEFAPQGVPASAGCVQRHLGQNGKLKNRNECSTVARVCQLTNPEVRAVLEGQRTKLARAGNSESDPTWMFGLIRAGWCHFLHAVGYKVVAFG